MRSFRIILPSTLDCESRHRCGRTCSTRSYRHGHDLVFQANGSVLAGLVGALVLNEVHGQEGEQEQATSRPWKAMHSKMQQTIECFLLSCSFGTCEV